MSRESLSLQQKLQQLYLETQNIRLTLQHINNDAQAAVMAARLEEPSQLIQRFLNGKENITRAMLDGCLQELAQGYNNYYHYYQQLRGEAKRPHAQIRKPLRRLMESFALRDFGAIRDLYDLINAAGAQRQSYADDEGAGLLLSFENAHDLTGRAPGVQKLLEMQISGSSPEWVFETLLWIGQRSARLREDGTWSEADLAGNIYHTHYRRLMDDLNNAPLDTQLSYIRLFNRQEIMNRDKLELAYARHYAQALQGLPQEQPQEQREAQAAAAAKAALEGTDLFRHAQAFHRMCDDLTGPMGSLLRQTQQGDPQPSIARRHGDIAALLDAPVTTANKAVIQQELNYSLLNVENAHTLQELLDRINSTAGRTSPTFRAMARMLTDFARENHNEVTDEKRYLKRLIACERTARQYKHLHENETANPRYTLAEDILAFCDRQRSAYLNRHNPDADEEISQLKATVNKNTDQLLRLARLQKASITASINPRIRNENPPVSRISRFFRALGHGMGNALSALANVTVGLPGNVAGLAMGTYVYLIKSPIRALLHGRMKKTPVGVAPGERDENLQTRLTDTVDPTTGVLTDIRRIPLVWEKPIPDDPNQPPTVSFRVLQARSGSAIAQSSNGDTGHSSLCIRYSRHDPITGRLQRYECSFGFGYKTPFNTVMDHGAMAQIGYRVPGEMKEEHGSFSAEKTLPINTQQLNRLIKYTQTYERGGYNLFERNCTTFLSDAAKVMGLDELKDILKEVDFDTEYTMAKLGVLSAPFIGNLLLAVNAERHAMNMANRDDLSYQRLGQPMVDKELFDRETHRTHNQRMRGYNPGAAGQAIRADGRFTLRNSDSRFVKAAAAHIKEASARIIEGKGSEPQIARMAGDFGVANYDTVDALINGNPIAARLLGMRRLLSDVMFRIINREQRGAVRQNLLLLQSQLLEYSENMIRAMGRYATESMNLRAVNRSNEQAAAMGSRLADEYLDALDQFYAVNLRSDGTMLEDFREIAAMAQKLKEAFDNQYHFCKIKNDSQAVVFGNPLQNTRDTALIVKRFMDGDTLHLTARREANEQEISERSSLPHTMAALRVYNNLKDYLLDCNTQKILKGQKPLSPQQKKELALIGKRLAAVNDMAASLKYMPMKKYYNDSNLNMLFNTLPANADYHGSGDKNMDSVRMLQCLSYEHVFHGILKAVGSQLEDKAHTALDELRKLQEERDQVNAPYLQFEQELQKLPSDAPERREKEKERDKLSQKVASRLTQIHQQTLDTRHRYMDDAAAQIGRELQKKLDGLTGRDLQYVRKIQNCIAQRMYTQERKTDPQLAPNAKDYGELAAQEILDTLVNTYAFQAFDTIMKRADKEGMLTAMADLSGDEIMKHLKVPQSLKAPLQGLTREDNPNLKAVVLNQNMVPQAPVQPVI